jgi:hypothetical protein
MIFIFLSVILVGGQSMVASDDDRDSSPDSRIFRVLSRSSIERVLVQASDAEVGGVHSDPGSEISIPGYLSLLGGSSDLFSGSSSSASHSDSDHEKCAISDNDLMQISRLVDLISNKIYGSSDFQGNVYSALDLYRLNFDPSHDRTLGDMLSGMLERHMTLRVDVNAHTINLRHMSEESQQRVNSQQLLIADIETLRKQLAQQDEHIAEISFVLTDLQNCLFAFQKEMRTFVDLMVTRQALLASKNSSSTSE